MKQTAAILACVLMLTPPVAGWNNTGHKTVAYLAYGKLNRKARARVDALVRQHPMFAEFSRGLTGPSAARMAFANFATWPDQIRGDKRFVDTPRVNAACKPMGTAKPAPVAVMAGFPDMERHQDWHYDDVPFSTDSTPTQPSCAPNAVTQMDLILLDLGSPSVADATKAFQLPWLAHLVGDVHQPLHAVSRFTKESPKGDLGGNQVKLKDGSNLHSFWDNLPGTVDTEPVISKLSATVAKSSKSVKVLTPRQWVDDSAAVARAEVYTFTGKGTPADPAVLSDQYKVAAKKLAFTRMAMAAHRLAGVINTTLGK